MEAATATMAFIGPRRCLRRGNWARRYYSRPRTAAQASWIRTGLSHRRSLAQSGGVVLPRARVLARTHPRPGDQMPRAGKAAHVRADLRDQDLRRRAHAGNRDEVLETAARYG